jgi:hypothetical protein
VNPIQIIRAKENEIRELRRREAAIVVDGEGNIILEKTSETDYEIAFTEEEITTIRAASNTIFTHNHPRGWDYELDDPRHAGHSFSPEDIFLACRAELAEIRAVTPIYRYSMQPPLGGWNESLWNVLWTIYQTEYAHVNRELTLQVMGNQLAVDEMEVEIEHLTWTRVAKLLGLVYNRSEE